MAIKTRETVASKLRKLFGTTGKTIVTALPDQVSGGGTLILYTGEEDNDIVAYKDPELTKPYTSYNEALTSVLNAGKVAIYSGDDPEVEEGYSFLIGMRSTVDGEGKKTLFGFTQEPSTETITLFLPSNEVEESDDSSSGGKK